METETKTNDIISFVETSGVEPQTAMTLKEKFLPFFEKAEEWKQKAEALVVTDVNQKREMQEARIARLALRDIRLEADKTRKALKEDSLRYGKAVQGVYNVIEYLIVPIERHLEEQEKFADIQEEKRRQQLKAEREAAIAPYGVDTTFYKLGEMPDDTWNALIESTKIAYEQKQAAIRRAEEDRIAREKAEAEEREKIRLENERLKKEAEAREKALAEERAKAAAERAAIEAKARAERQAAEAKAKAEREVAEAKAKKEREEAARKLKAEQDAKAKLEAELKAKEDAEAKAKKEAEVMAEAEAAKGDKDRFDDFLKALMELKNKYSFKSEKYNKLYSVGCELLDKILKHLTK